jgi:hypothetical protein
MDPFDHGSSLRPRHPVEDDSPSIGTRLGDQPADIVQIILGPNLYTATPTRDAGLGVFLTVDGQELHHRTNW